MTPEYLKLDENEIKEIQEMVRYWLLEDERHTGEQLEKLSKLEYLIDRTLDRCAK